MNHDTLSKPSDRLAAYILIGLGALLLIGPVFHFSFVGIVWPFFVIVPGAAFLYFAYTGSNRTAGLAVPGAIVTGTGLILLYQSMTNHWESWAYVWTLYAVFLGWSLQFMGQRTGNKQEFKVGSGFVKVGLVSFVSLYILFELLIFHNVLSGFGGLVLPLALIGVGVYLLVGTDGLGSLLSSNGKLFTGPRVVGKSKNGYSPAAGDRLRKKIDEALAEIEGEGGDTEA